MFTLLIFETQVLAQTNNFKIQAIKLPAELSDFDNQFSCLNISKGRLFLMPECRILENQQARLYSVELTAINEQMADSSFPLPYKKHLIIGFDKLVRKMMLAGQVCEGLEAMVIKRKQVYLSVETTTESPYCYLLKGKFRGNDLYLDTNKLLAIKKPVEPDGTAIYNASFESVELRKKRLLLFFEFNYFSGKNYVYSFNKHLDPASKDSVEIVRMPFRISDIKSVGKDHYTGINIFFKGGGRDTINRPSPGDTANLNIVFNGKAFHNYARLIDIFYNGKIFTWQTLYEIPATFEGFNWEGIAPYRHGYFIVNDKYTTAKPYYSALMYLHRR